MWIGFAPVRDELRALTRYSGSVWGDTARSLAARRGAVHPVRDGKFEGTFGYGLEESA